MIEVKEKKKREVKAAADAMDVDKDTGPSGTLGKLVDKAVAKAVKKVKAVHSVSTFLQVQLSLLNYSTL